MSPETCPRETCPPPMLSAPLVARMVNCRACQGRGGGSVVACDACACLRRALGRPEAGWQGADALALWTFPCEHPTMPHNVRQAWKPCAICQGAGEVTERRTEAQWGRRDTRNALRSKRALSQSVLLMAGAERALGFSEAHIQRFVLSMLPLCGARGKRTGKPCVKRVVLGKTRCRWHGGLSTGPRTRAGRERIGAARAHQKKGVLQ